MAVHGHGGKGPSRLERRNLEPLAVAEHKRYVIARTHTAEHEDGAVVGDVDDAGELKRLAQIERRDLARSPDVGGCHGAAIVGADEAGHGDGCARFRKRRGVRDEFGDRMAQVIVRRADHTRFSRDGQVCGTTVFRMKET